MINIYQVIFDILNWEMEKKLNAQKYDIFFSFWIKQTCFSFAVIYEQQAVIFFKLN